MLTELLKCELCPHRCKVNRINKQIGNCGCSDKVKIALASIHQFEEPCISGTNGSGTVFFSRCNLHCKYCQNYEISQLGKGIEIGVEELANVFLRQQEKKVHNINLVTPTMYVPQIIEAIKIAREKGLVIPIIYNSNGYETVETIQKLEGFIDVYLPDLKYYGDDLAFKYSGIKNYFENATEAIKEMERQVGAPQFDENGMITKGLMIRHLVLPNQIENSKQVLTWMKENINEEVYVNIMAQYFPCYQAKEINELNRKLSKEEYQEIENFVYELDIKNGYMQELGEHEEEYVPDFNLTF